MGVHICAPVRLPVPEDNSRVSIPGHILVSDKAGTLSESLPVGGHGLNVDRVVVSPLLSCHVSAGRHATDNLALTPSDVTRITIFLAEIVYGRVNLVN